MSSYTQTYTSEQPTVAVCQHVVVAVVAAVSASVWRWVGVLVLFVVCRVFGVVICSRFLIACCWVYGYTGLGW